MTMLMKALAWLASPDSWAGPTGIWTRLFQHAQISAVSLALAALLALPIGIAVGHTGKGTRIVGAFAGAFRSIPTLGILTILALLLGVGTSAPILTLVILAIPSLLAGATGGVGSVDHATVEAMRAMGMSEWEIMWRVELPLAFPVIVGGVRAAMLQVIATATLAAYVADVGLGRYIFAGLKTRDYPLMMAGALLVITMTLCADALMAWFQRFTTRKAFPLHDAQAGAR
ncbi:ABC transporter permease [Actinomyces vulturis]|uniref:ABC transporter permease n=1 Tax=Actinomyces vulturis TaxID=1857645 RepID=UPI000832667F|nr:ABC transporter permease [Actinomyces vulturis]